MSSKPTGPMLIQSIANIKLVEFTVPTIIDQLQIEHIQQELVSLVEKPGQPKMIISFDGVNSISSAMLGTLITLHKKAKAGGGAVRLAHIAPSLMQVFKLTNLHKLLPIFDSTDKALEKF